MARAWKAKEKTMKKISETDLTSRADSELSMLFHEVSKALAHTKPGTIERREVIASLQNISRERARRHRQNKISGF